MSWEAPHLSRYAHKSSLCTSERADYHSEHRDGAGSVVDGIVVVLLLVGRARPMRWEGWCHATAATFRPVWINSHWALGKRHQHLAEPSAAPGAPAHLKAARRHKRRFLFQPRCIQADAQYRRSRTAAAWKQHRDPAGFSRVFFSSFFFSFLEVGGADFHFSRCDGIKRDSSFICWSWMSWRASPLSQAVKCYRSRCASFGTPELSTFSGSRDVPSAPISSGTTPAQSRPLLISLHVSSAR